jgi:NADH-quinone oxidoreductase subunit E/NADP-reducing hydrogenase subunit HndA
VITFYHFFRTRPAGKHTLHLCLGTACHVRGAERILKAIHDELGAGLGETSADGLFTVEGVRCVGACGLAPVMMVGDEVYGKLDVKRTERILRQIREGSE